MIVKLKDIDGPAHLVKAWHYGEKKRVHVWTVNLPSYDVSEDLDLALMEFEMTQARNTRSKKPKALHQIIAFAKEDGKPPLELLKEIERRQTAAIGMEDHQRLASVHEDTDYYHLHIICNRIHPEKFNRIDVWYERKRAMDCRRGLEKEFGLRIVDGRSRGMPAKALDSEAHSLESSFARYVLDPERQKKLEACRREATTWDDFHRGIARHGLGIKKRGAGLVFHALGGRKTDHLQASRLGTKREFGMKAMEREFGPFEPARGISPRMAEERFRPGPVTLHPQQGPMWQKYRKRKSAAVSALDREITRNWRKFLEAGQDINDPLAIAILKAQRGMFEGLTPGPAQQPSRGLEP